MIDKSKRPPNINLDNILLELGQFGKYQFQNYLLLIVPIMFAGCNNGNYIFTAVDLDYRHRLCLGYFEVSSDPSMALSSDLNQQNPKTMSKEIDLDQIITELGSFGRFQLMNYALIALGVVFANAYATNYMFTAMDDKYRCYIPECDSSLKNAILETDWLANAMPFSNLSRRCTRYAPLNNSSYETEDSCPAELFDQSKSIECEEWVFNSGKSVVKELGIQCESWKRTLIGTIHSCGLLCALPLVAFISDNYGRKVAFTLSAFFAGVLGLCRSFTSNYTTFLIFEFLEPLLGSGVYSSGFILGMELVGPKRRVIGATILCTFYSLGGVLLGVFAWCFQYWRTLLRVIYAPSLLFISYFFIINESVRWLISRGHYEDAINVIKKAAKVNGVTLTEKCMENLYSNVDAKNEHEDENTNENENKSKVSPGREVFRSATILTRVAKCSFWWITCTLVYYGLSINSALLAGNVYLNYMLVCLVELPAYLTGCFFLTRIGRKYTLSSAFFISGSALILFPYLPKGLFWLSLTLYLIGKFFITMAFGSLYIYTSELFPTNLRHSLLGTCSMIGRLGSIAAPQAPLLAEYMASLPSLIFGGCAITSSLLMLTSPETLNIKLPDTVAEAKKLSRKPKKVEIP